MKNKLRFECDKLTSHGRCCRIPYAEVFPHTIKTTKRVVSGDDTVFDEEDYGWSYLCRWHYILDRIQNLICRWGNGYYIVEWKEMGMEEFLKEMEKW